MRAGTVDRVLGVSMLLVAAATMLIIGLFMGEGWTALGWAASILVVGVAAGWWAERRGREGE